MSRRPRTVVVKTATRPSPPSYAELEARVAVLTAELREAREQQTATAEAGHQFLARPPCSMRCSKRRYRWCAGPASACCG